MMQTAMGQLATRCLELVVLTECGITVTLSDLSAEEAACLPIVKAELDTWRAEKQQAQQQASRT